MQPVLVSGKSGRRINLEYSRAEATPSHKCPPYVFHFENINIMIDNYAELQPPMPTEGHGEHLLGLISEALLDAHYGTKHCW